MGDITTTTATVATTTTNNTDTTINNNYKELTILRREWGDSILGGGRGTF